jgi:peptidoglycan/LPS O-acetylase OafA/YrhL
MNPHGKTHAVNLVTQNQTVFAEADKNAKAISLPRQRLAGIEWLRIAACFGIVWFHAHAPGASVGYGGLPAFMIVSVSLAAMPRKSLSIRDVITSRFWRLGMPWIFWSIVYGSAKLFHALFEGRPLTSEFTSSMLLYGASLHLWYLPFAMVVTAIVNLIAIKGFLRNDKLAIGGYIISAALLLFVCSWLLTLMNGSVPFSQWVFILPSITIGMALAAIPAGRRESLPYLFGILIVLMGACAFGEITTSAELAVPYCAGIFACILAWTMPQMAGSVVARIASLSFGIYLIHPLIISFLIKLGFADKGILLAIFGFILSAVLTRIMQLTPFRVFI